MGSVFVLDAHGTPALVAIRRLAAGDLDVTAGSAKCWYASRLLQCVDRYVSYPDPATEPEGFLDAVERELEKGDYDMLLPIVEDTVGLVVQHGPRFEQYTNVPFQEYERLLVGLDKRQTVEAVRETNVPQPTTLFSDETSLEGVEAVLNYPIVVKDPRGEGRNGVQVCESSDELVQATQRIEKVGGNAIFQEFIPNGGEFGVYTLYDWAGDLVGLTVQRRIRSLPPEGGASTYRETVEQPELVDLAEEFLTEIDWRGLAMVEFRVDARTGEPQLIEMNPRFWGSLSLSTYAGVDFPNLLYQLALGENPEPVVGYEVGVRSRCLFREALHVVERTDRLRALREVFRPSPVPCTYDIISTQDPLPTVGQFAYYAARAYDRVN